MAWVTAKQAMAVARAEHQGKTWGDAPHLRAADVSCTWGQLGGSQSLGCSRGLFAQKCGHGKTSESRFGYGQGREEAAPGDRGTLTLGKTPARGPACSAPEPGPRVRKTF